MKRIVSLALTFALVLMMSFACKSEQTNTSASTSTSTSASASQNSAAPAGSTYSKKYSIGCLYSEITGDFWGIVYNGCMKALNELAVYGIQGYCIAPANGNDYTLQMELLDAAILKKVDGITLSPVNEDSIGAYITDNFKESGFPIVVIDRSINTTSKWVVSEVMADTYAMGEECGKLAIEATGGKGKYVLYGLSVLNTNWANRSKGAMDYIQKNSNMQNGFDTGDGIWSGIQSTDEQSFQFIQDQCTSHPDDILVFITSCEAYTNNVIAAIGELAARKPEAPIYIIGFDFSMTSYNYIKDKQIYGAVGQNPYLMGYMSTYAVINYLEAGKIDKFIPVPYCVVTQTNMGTQEVKDYFVSMELKI